MAWTSSERRRHFAGRAQGWQLQLVGSKGQRRARENESSMVASEGKRARPRSSHRVGELNIAWRVECINGSRLRRKSQRGSEGVTPIEDSQTSVVLQPPLPSCVCLLCLSLRLALLAFWVESSRPPSERKCGVYRDCRSVRRRRLVCVRVCVANLPLARPETRSNLRNRARRA